MYQPVRSKCLWRLTTVSFISWNLDAQDRTKNIFHRGPAWGLARYRLVLGQVTWPLSLIEGETAARQTRDGCQTGPGSREMQARLLWLVWLLCIAAAADAARLLAVLPTNTKSHYAMYGKLVEALVRRQHHLTVISHFPMVCIFILNSLSELSTSGLSTGRIIFFF